MTDPTDKQLEWAARLLCVAFSDLDPDRVIESAQDRYKGAAWSHPLRLLQARRLLAELERQGVKMLTDTATTRMVNYAIEASGTCHRTEMSDWALMHDGAPICPNAD